MLDTYTIDVWQVGQLSGTRKGQHMDENERQFLKTSAGDNVLGIAIRNGGERGRETWWFLYNHHIKGNPYMEAKYFDSFFALLLKSDQTIVREELANPTPPEKPFVPGVRLTTTRTAKWISRIFFFLIGVGATLLVQKMVHSW